MDGESWGEASVTHPDWKGTAQLDERATVLWEGLTRKVALKPEEWQVVGFSVGGGESGYRLRVAAAPRDVWENLEPNAPVELTEFLVHGIDPLAVLQEMTHMFELKMRHRSVDDRELRVVAWSDLPAELFMEETFGLQDG